MLAVLWHVADGVAALAYLAGASHGWLAAALAALTAQTVLSALRWRLTAAQLGITLTRLQALREYYLSQVVNQALPGGVLGDAGRAVRVRAQAGLLAAGQAVLFERLAGQLALLCVFGVALAGTLMVPGGVDWPGWLVMPGLVAVLAGGVIVIAAILPPVPLPGSAGRAIRGFRTAALHALAAPEVRARQIVMSIGTALCNVAAFGFCAAAVGVTLAPATAAVLVPMILFAMLIPVSVSGWGLREGAAAALLPLAGATSAEGFAASVAFGLAFLVCALPGVLAVMFNGQRMAVRS
jgi:uncharacterized membrane protein YbhN (UPF0104 family)